jgi:hypothetical protein
LKVTVPVASEGETEAESATSVPSTGVEVETLSVVVLAVLPPVFVVEPSGACQKSPQPVVSSVTANNRAARRALRISIHPHTRIDDSHLRIDEAPGNRHTLEWMQPAALW